MHRHAVWVTLFLLARLFAFAEPPAHTFVLAKAQPPSTVVSTVSGLIEPAKLATLRDTGDWEAWLAFFLRGVAEVSAEATETSRRILALREGYRALVTAHLGRTAGHGHRVLEHLFQKPILSVADVRQLTGTTYPAANNLVSRLAERGIIQEITGYKRNRLFRYEPYIALFGEDPPAESARKPATEESAK